MMKGMKYQVLSQHIWTKWPMVPRPKPAMKMHAATGFGSYRNRVGGVPSSDVGRDIAIAMGKTVTTEGNARQPR